MRILVYGAGAIGGPLGAFLHLAGIETVLIARGEHLARIREDGLTVLTPDQRLTVRMPAVGHPAELQPRTGDMVALTMKAQDTEAAVRALRDAGWDPFDTALYCVQNCLANETISARYFGRVYGVMIVIPGTHLEPGVVVSPITGNHGYMDVGCWPHGLDEGVSAFVDAATAAGYSAHPHADVMASKAVKFLGNLGNAMDAITDGRGDAASFMSHVREEALACLAADGLAPEDEAAHRARVRSHRGVNRPVNGFPDKRSSTWQSLVRGQGSIEADFLNGEVVLLGRLHGIPTPYNVVLQQVATTMATRRQPPGSYSVEDLTALATVAAA